MVSNKKIVIIAGPNGAGKTTFALDYLIAEVGCPIFINADLIAAGLSPLQPEKSSLRAGKLMLQEIYKCVQKGVNFSFETTLSGTMYARLIPEWQRLGFHIQLIFLSLPNVEMAKARVAARVKMGGHNISNETIHRRFFSGLNNFHNLYKKLVDSWILYDNSFDVPFLIEMGERI